MHDGRAWEEYILAIMTENDLQIFLPCSIQCMPSSTWFNDSEHLLNVPTNASPTPPEIKWGYSKELTYIMSNTL